MLSLALFGIHFVCFWLHFECFWHPIGVLLVPGWSIWLHFDALEPTLHPTTPQNSFCSVPGVLASWVFGVPDLWVPVSILLDVRLFLNGFQQIVHRFGHRFATKLVRTTFFVFFSAATAHTPNIPSPHTTPTNIKTWPDGMRARREGRAS